MGKNAFALGADFLCPNGIDPRGIFINACNHITWSMPSRYLRSLSIEGLNAHENGHDLFTDNRIARACSIRDVVDLLSIQVIRDTGTQLHCRCPFCADRKAHLNVKLDKNVFRCNRCGEGGGVLHLYAAATNISMAAAYEELCRIFQSGEDIRRRKLNDTPRNQKIVTPEAELAPSNIRDNTYRNLLSLLTLGSMHRESLLMRGLSGDAIDQLGYRTTPAVRSGRIVAELLERGCELEGVPGFYRDHETGSWKLDIRASGIMIPDRNMIGEIEAIQIRLDRPYKSKFNNLTSVDKYYGTTASCCPHFAGPHDSDAVYLTEGVMKADIAQHLSNALGQPRCFVGLTGVGNINQFRRLLKELATVHINRIIVAFDMDALINENVRNARHRVLQEGSDAGFEMTPIAWDEKYKGIDDLLLSFKEARAS